MGKGNLPLWGGSPYTGCLGAGGADWALWGDTRGEEGGSEWERRPSHRLPCAAGEQEPCHAEDKTEDN